MVVVQALQLNLPKPQSSSISSLLFEPTSLSLALMHSDSSFSLYPSLSLSLSLFPFPFSPTTTPPTSSATFLRLHPSRVLFITSSPYLSGSSILLRFWILRNTNNHHHHQSFAKLRIISNQADLSSDDTKSGLVFRVNHGLAIRLAGSINVFAMYSVSNRKIWVFSVKMMAGDHEVEDHHKEGLTIKVMKCAVIDCTLPVFSISVSSGFLILGEENGVRVFPLRPLVKGRAKKHHRRVKNNEDRLEDYLPNGEADRPIDGTTGFSGRSMMNAEGTLQISSNGHLEYKIGKHSENAKLKSVKLRQDSREGTACFVAFKSKVVESFNSTEVVVPLKLVKAISVQVLSPNKFLILDSVGDLHLLSLSNLVSGSEIPCQIKKLTLSMKVQNLAVFPDISTRAQTVWISDGHHTIHALVLSDMDSSVGDSDSNDNDENFQSSVVQAIFASEKIQEIVPLAANAILVLGQGFISLRFDHMLMICGG